MIKLIKPYRLHGTITLPDSKSIAHRALICAYNHDLSYTPDCDDTRVTSDAMRVLRGAARGDSVNIYAAKISAGESGSTLRFLIPFAAALGINVTYTRHGKLPTRPLAVYEKALPAHGVTLANIGDNLQVRGTLRGGRFELAGDVSSQFITGLLLSILLSCFTG